MAPVSQHVAALRAVVLHVVRIRKKLRVAGAILILPILAIMVTYVYSGSAPVSYYVLKRSASLRP